MAGFVVGVSLGVVLAACEVLVVVSGRIVDDVEDEDVGSEVVCSRVVEVVFVEPTVVVASVVANEVASDATLVTASGVEVDAEV